MALSYAALTWIPSVLIRGHGWSVGDVGKWYSMLLALTGVAGLLGNGRLTDQLFAAGRSDAHLRFYMWGAAIVGASGAAGALMPTGLALLAALLPVLVLLNFIGVAVGGLLLVTPAGLRGKMTALFQMTIGLFGASVGPVAVGLLSDRVVGSDRLGSALGILFAVLGPVAAITFAFGLRPMRAMCPDDQPSQV